MRGKFVVLALTFLLSQSAFAVETVATPPGDSVGAAILEKQSEAPTTSVFMPERSTGTAFAVENPKPVSLKWYERISLRGYTQFRFNRIGNPTPALVNSQGDRSIGGTNGFFIRRARLIFSGDITDHIYVYIQPDMASTPDYASSAQVATNFLQMRDLYADIFLDTNKEFRLRLGQSKVPFGFENMQSSQNRLALDRNDALNTAARDERDLGLYFYWAPKEIRARFKYLVDSGLKGSGDYGVFGIGMYNGQLANRPDRNRKLHSVARITYPFQFGNGQIVEASLQAYTGQFNVSTAAIAGSPAPAAVPAGNGADFKDERWAASLIVYPQPLGFQAEYTSGKGPRLNGAFNGVELANLEGGYAQVMYKHGHLMPFVRAQYYKGGRKHDVNAIYQDTRETEIGVEWEAITALELTGMYTWTSRSSAAYPFDRVSGNLIRIQAQINY